MNQDQWQQQRGEALKASADDLAVALKDVKLTRQQISQVLDETSVDAAKLREFVRIVTDAERSNADKASQIRNIDGLAEIAVSLAGKLLAA
jgi:hypothetical protein